MELLIKPPALVFAGNPVKVRLKALVSITEYTLNDLPSPLQTQPPGLTKEQILQSPFAEMVLRINNILGYHDLGKTFDDTTFEQDFEISAILKSLQQPIPFPEISPDHGNIFQNPNFPFTLQAFLAYYRDFTSALKVFNYDFMTIKGTLPKEVSRILEEENISYAQKYPDRFLCFEPQGLPKYQHHPGVLYYLPPEDTSLKLISILNTLEGETIFLESQANALLANRVTEIHLYLTDQPPLEKATFYLADIQGNQITKKTTWHYKAFTNPYTIAFRNKLGVFGSFTLEAIPDFDIITQKEYLTQSPYPHTSQANLSYKLFFPPLTKTQFMYLEELEQSPDIFIYKPPHRTRISIKLETDPVNNIANAFPVIISITEENQESYA